MNSLSNDRSTTANAFTATGLRTRFERIALFGAVLAALLLGALVTGCSDAPTAPAAELGSPRAGSRYIYRVTTGIESGTSSSYLDTFDVVETGLVIAGRRGVTELRGRMHGDYHYIAVDARGDLAIILGQGRRHSADSALWLRMPMSPADTEWVEIVEPMGPGADPMITHITTTFAGEEEIAAAGRRVRASRMNRTINWPLLDITAAEAHWYAPSIGYFARIESAEASGTLMELVRYEPR